MSSVDNSSTLLAVFLNPKLYNLSQPYSRAEEEAVEEDEQRRWEKTLKVIMLKKLGGSVSKDESRIAGRCYCDRAMFYYNRYGFSTMA